MTRVDGSTLDLEPQPTSWRIQNAIGIRVGKVDCLLGRGHDELFAAELARPGTTVAPDATDHALVFTARVGDREVEGCDFVHLNTDGLIDELVVMVRPMSGLTALATAMGAALGVELEQQ